MWKKLYNFITKGGYMPKKKKKKKGKKKKKKGNKKKKRKQILDDAISCEVLDQC